MNCAEIPVRGWRPDPRAIDLLARQYEADGMAVTAAKLRDGLLPSTTAIRALRAIEAALAEPREGRS